MSQYLPDLRLHLESNPEDLVYTDKVTEILFKPKESKYGLVKLRFSITIEKVEQPLSSTKFNKFALEKSKLASKTGIPVSLIDHRLF